MNKRQWFLVAAVIVLAGCPGGINDICVPAGFSENENHNRDQVDQVECRAVPREPATTPAPRIDP